MRHANAINCPGLSCLLISRFAKRIVGLAAASRFGDAGESNEKASWGVGMCSESTAEARESKSRAGTIR